MSDISKLTNTILSLHIKDRKGIWKERRKNFYCLAVNLLELSDLQAAMEQLKQDDKLLQMPKKEQCLYVTEIVQNIADKRDVKLKLIKKAKK